MDCINKNCPASAKCLAPYRGSRCAATRASYGLGDPLTKADRIRAMTDENLAAFLVYYERCPDGSKRETSTDCYARKYHGSCEDCWLEWLRQEEK